MTGAELRPRGVWGVIGAVLLLSLAGLQAAETIPPAPERFFNDYAGVVSSETEQRLNTALENLERTDSTQILVAVYPKMESDSAMEDYTVRVARSWRVGQTNFNNGAILFVFMEDRAMRIEVGYGLEGAIPDVTAKRIIENEIIPHFRNGNPEQGLAAGVQAMIAAAKGEYQGSGQTVGGSSNRRRSGESWFGLFFIVFILLSIIGRVARRGRGYSYRRRGRTVWGGPFIGGFGGRGGFGGGGFGGGFSGGGGSFGGGGASGSW